MRKIIIAGADPDTGNLGVSALGSSAACTLKEIDEGLDITIIDSRPGIRKGYVYNGFKNIDVTLCGAKNSKKFYQNESMINISTCTNLNINWNPVSNHIKNSHTILDISGGDSFTDLYGRKRFKSINILKNYAIKNKIPFILLPQTYGPFSNQKIKEEAKHILKMAKMAWARDLHSYEIMKELLGESFDPSIHKSGVDMAFLLPPKKCLDKIDHNVRYMLEKQKTKKIGINISGLIFNDPEKAKQHYKFHADYNNSIKEIIKKILENDKHNIILIPHVLTDIDHYESDLRACMKIIDELDLASSNRISIQKQPLNENEVKWLISEMDWFMGTRMHATIAALSTETPVSTISYSDKATGVFESCNMLESVINPRTLSTQEVIEKILTEMERSEELKETLSKSIPEIIKTAKNQMNEIYDTLHT